MRRGCVRLAWCATANKEIVQRRAVRPPPACATRPPPACATGRTPAVRLRDAPAVRLRDAPAVRGAGCRLITEEIETDLEAATLTELGVEFGRGYLFGRPEPLPPG